MSTHFRKLSIKEVRRETPECVSIAFDLPGSLREEFAFEAGQNLTIKFNINGEELRRSYSICSSPFENELRVAVKKVIEGRFSTHANLQLKAGDVLEVLAPTGRFIPHLHADQKKNYLAIAGGSGITPVISIIKTILATEPRSSFTLIYGNRTRASIIFKEELEALKNKYLQRFSLFHILSRETSDSPLHEGRINEEKLNKFSLVMDIFSFDDYFLCGPGDLIAYTRLFLEKHGVKPGSIHYELFTVPGQELAAQDVKSTDKKSETEKSNITIKSDGISFDFELPYQSIPILDAANAQGADLPYACKAGVCSTCRAKLIEGKVEMNVNYSLEEDELEAGFILTCQSHPRSEKVVIDFDAK